jgi:hypothetical protein
MKNAHTHYRELYGKKLRSGLVTFKVDSVEKSRIEKIVLITRRNKSDLIRDALFEYFQKFEGII